MRVHIMIDEVHRFPYVSFFRARSHNNCTLWISFYLQERTARLVSSNTKLFNHCTTKQHPSPLLISSADRWISLSFPRSKPQFHYYIVAIIWNQVYLIIVHIAVGRSSRLTSFTFTCSAADTLPTGAAGSDGSVLDLCACNLITAFAVLCLDEQYNSGWIMCTKWVCCLSRIVYCSMYRRWPNVQGALNTQKHTYL